jgi:8-oxo-dGTP pyrophosphatase MutT (NUDIX family)
MTDGSGNGPNETGPRAQPGSHRSSGSPQVVSSERLYSGAVIDLRVDEIRTPSGIVRREVVEHPGAVVIAAVDVVGRVALARQYRHAVGGHLLEFPAGGLNPGEDPEAAARRELREEVGVEAEEWLPLGAFYSSPGFLHEELHAYLATGLSSTDQDLDDDEEIEVIWARIEDLETGQIQVHDAKTLATLHLLRRHRAVGGGDV